MSPCEVCRLPTHHELDQIATGKTLQSQLETIAVLDTGSLSKFEV